MKTVTMMCNECKKSFKAYASRKVKSIMKFTSSCKSHGVIKDDKYWEERAKQAEQDRLSEPIDMER